MLAVPLVSSSAVPPETGDQTSSQNNGSGKDWTAQEIKQPILLCCVVFEHCFYGKMEVIKLVVSLKPSDEVAQYT